MCKDNPSEVYLLKQGSPLVIGLGEGENFFASDALAIIEHTKKIVFLQDGEMGVLTDSTFELFDDAGNTYSREPKILDLDEENVGKGGYKHFMLKEIHEQPAIISKTIQRLVDFDKKDFNYDSLGLSGIDFNKVKNIHIIGCGTAFLAGMIGRYVIESVSKIPCQVELASEFRYRDPYLSEDTLIIPITQSGETADTLACVKHAVDAGCQSLAVCNVMYSSIPRASTSTLYMEAGPEIGVASTKAFTSQVLCLYLAAHAMAKKVGKEVNFDSLLSCLKILPQEVEKAVNLGDHIEDISKSYYEDTSCIFIGRHVNSAIAYEGALKLKEISYIHAEGYPGGELKHGPIALIDKHMPVVSIAPLDEHYEKMISNIEEVRAREGRILGVGNEGDDKFEALCENYIPVPKSDCTVLQSILNVVALQLFSYHVAVRRGTDVDQPRNLAKSVTVE
jgi:glucosamine--fructose-6-phosphate aminotransferase (isomerizing)